MACSLVPAGLGLAHVHVGCVWPLQFCMQRAQMGLLPDACIYKLTAAVTHSLPVCCHPSMAEACRQENIGRAFLCLQT